MTGPSVSAPVTAGPAVVPETYGAIGDGATDDSLALQAALATGRHVSLKRGSTYKVSSPLVLAVAGQQLTGGTLKRANQSGSTEWFTVRVTAADCRVTGVTFDGNKTNYTTAGWATTAEINVEPGAHRTIIDGCYLHDVPGEGIEVGGSDNVRVQRNAIVDVNGNGIHYGGSGGPYRGGRVVGNSVKNVNLNTGVGHADGCVIVSNATSDFLVDGNYLENGISGVGSIDSVDNLDVTISNNEIRSMTATAIEGDCPSGASAVNVLIQGNRIYDSISLKINQQGGVGSANFPLRWVVNGNLFSNTKLAPGFADQLVISGNEFDGATAANGGMNYIDLTSPKHVVISGNVFKAGATAVNAGGSTRAENILISGNVMVGQYTAGINAYTDSMVALQSVNNAITSDGVNGGGWYGIRLKGKNIARGNTINMIAGGSRCIDVNSGDTPVVKDNLCRGAATIVVRAGVTNAIVKDNEVSAVISDSGTSTTVSGNTTLTGLLA